MRGFCVVFLCVLATPAFSGAWQRAQGHWFSSTSVEWGLNGAAYTSFYGEYGAFSWLTLGLDAGRSSLGQGAALVFARAPLWASDNAHLSLEFAAGEDADRSVVRPKLSFGRGFALGSGSGWIALDGMAVLDVGAGSVSYKLDGTLGISPNDRWKMILQTQTELTQNGNHVFKVAPSLVRRLGDHLLLEIGARETLVGGQETAIKVGFWLEY